MFKNPRATFALIILLTVLALYIDLPNLKILDRQISHPKIETKVLKRDLEPKLGLDLSGGVQLVLSADMGNIDSSDRDNALDSAQNVIENRINSLGVSEPIVQTAKTGGHYRLIVEIPGISEIDQAVATVKKTAHLEFRVLLDNAPPEATLAALPEYFVSSKLTGKDLKRAQASPSQDPQNPGYVVDLEFSGDGSKKLEDITKANLNLPMAMFLDDEPISWPPPIIRAVISDGNAQI